MTPQQFAALSQEILACEADEQSLVLVEKGDFLGFGYLDKSVSVSSLEEAKLFVKPSKENRIVQNLVNSFLVSPSGGEIIVFEEHEV